MKIYLAHSTGFDFVNELYRPIQGSAIFQKHTWIIPHADNSFINSKEALKIVDLVIAEVSYPSTGMGIELGWANMLDKKVICIYRSDKTYSSSLETVCGIFIPYNSKEELIEKLELEMRI